MRTWLKNPTGLCTLIGGLASVIHALIVFTLFSDLVSMPLPTALRGYGYEVVGLSLPMMIAGPSVGCLFATLVLQWKL